MANKPMLRYILRPWF